MSIKGNTVSTPTPRTDWNQTDPNKADYLKGKPDLEASIQAAQQAATSAITAANNAQTSVAGAYTAADTAQTTANEAKTAAGNAQTVANNAQTTADEAHTAIDEHKEDKNNPHEVTCAQIGATSMTLLWENASPGSAFAEQTIQMNLSGYDAVLIEFYVLSVGDHYIVSFWGRLNEWIFANMTSGSSSLRLSRTNQVLEDSILFGRCSANGDSVTEVKDKMIPLRVYGIKGVNAQKTLELVSFGDVTMDKGYYVNYQTGEVKTTPMQSATQKYIAVEPGATYQMTYTGSETSIEINACFYNADKGYTFDGDISSSDLTVKGGTYSLLKKAPPFTFTVPSGCYYMRFHSSAFTDITDWHLYKLRGD